MKIFQFVIILLWQLFMIEAFAQNNSNQNSKSDSIVSKIKDMDGDGIIDSLDKCPDVPGKIENEGCPYIPGKVHCWGCNDFDIENFESGKYFLLYKEMWKMNKILQMMANNPKYYLKLYGYCDSKETILKSKALQLSKKRAEVVMNYLVSNGIDKKRIYYDGYGKTNFIAVNSTKEGRQLNRRVEFKLYLPWVI